MTSGRVRLIIAQGPTGIKAVGGMIDDDMTALPETVRDIGRLYLDQIAVLTQKIDELHFKLRAATTVDDAVRRLRHQRACSKTQTSNPGCARTKVKMSASASETRYPKQVEQSTQCASTVRTSIATRVRIMALLISTTAVECLRSPVSMRQTIFALSKPIDGNGCA